MNINHSSAKSKFKLTELVSNENKSVRFMNKSKSNLNGVSRNTTNIQNSHMGQKNTFIKNPNSRWRPNNNLFKHPPKANLKSNQNVVNNVPQVGLTKSSYNELRNGGGKKIFPPRNTKNLSHGDTKKQYFNKLIIQNHNEDKYKEQKNVIKYLNDDTNLMKNDNPHGSGNSNNNPSRLYNSSYNSVNDQLENSKNDYGNNTEDMIYTHSSPIKRKYEVLDNINKNDEHENKDMKTYNKKFAPRNYNFENNLNLEYNKTFCSMNNISGSINENSSNYNNMLHSNEKLLSNNNISHKGLNSNTLFGSSHDDVVLNRPHQARGTVHAANTAGGKSGTIVSAGDLFNSSSLGRNYSNYNRLKSSDNFLSNSNYESGYKYFYGERGAKANLEVQTNVTANEIGGKFPIAIASGSKNMVDNANKYFSENVHNNYRSENHNNASYYFSNCVMRNKGHRKTSYITDTNSEKMINSSNNKDMLNSSIIDRLSEENFNSYMKRKTENKCRISNSNNLEEGSVFPNNGNRNVPKSSSKNRNNLMTNDEENYQDNEALESSKKMDLKNSLIIESNNMDLKNMSTSLPHSEGKKMPSNNGEQVHMKNRRDMHGMNIDGCYKARGEDVKEQEEEEVVREKESSYFDEYGEVDILPKNIMHNDHWKNVVLKRHNMDVFKNNDNDYLYFQNIIHNITKCSSGENDINMLCKNVMNLNDYSLNFDTETEYINEIANISNSVNNNIRTIQQAIYNKKKIVQDKRNIVNEEYEIISQKLKDCESIFCDTDEETGGKKLKVFYEIDEKKNILRKKYELKKMQLKKAQYKIDKLQEYTNVIKMKTMAIAEKYKKCFSMIENFFRLKIIKDNDNELEVCLIPKNTETNMWHRLQLDKNEITSEASDYLWSQIESFVDKETFDNYF
ncbi:cyclin related protein, putative [Plasmodium ovale]|nr:cyclin related protein, putative [Plasmodium ovale]